MSVRSAILPVVTLLIRGSLRMKLPFAHKLWLPLILSLLCLAGISIYNAYRGALKKGIFSYVKPSRWSFSRRATA
jgi:hypothetical protein